MPLQWTTNPQKTVPTAASAVSVTPSATSWGNSTWVQLVASAPAAMVVTGLVVPVAGVAQPFEVDVGIGGVGAEVVVTTFRGIFQDVTFRGLGVLAHVVPLDAIPASSRVSVRMRKNGTTVTPWAFALTYLDKPIVGNLQTTVQPQLAVPAAANGITLSTPTTAWANGAWTVLTASTGTAWVVTQVILQPLNNGAEWEVDVGVGGAGSEAVITTIHGQRSGNADGPNSLPLWNVLDAIPASSRVVARVRCADTFARTTTIALAYHGKPL